jgi:hypothetical protein
MKLLVGSEHLKNVPSGEQAVGVQRVGRCFSLKLSGMQGRRSRQEKALVVANHRTVVVEADQAMVVVEAGEAEVGVVIQEAQRSVTRVTSNASSAN